MKKLFTIRQQYKLKSNLYHGMKLAVGTAAAIGIAELLKLNYSTTAGIIALLSILTTRKETYLVGLKRFLGSGIALGMAAILFYFLGYHIFVFLIFMLFFVWSMILLGMESGISVGTVLVTHLYTIKDIDASILWNEFFILFIGVAMGFLLNLHMADEGKRIERAKERADDLIREILFKMAAQLLNACSMKEPEDLLGQLDICIERGLEAALLHEMNNPFKNLAYSSGYFRMRREQYVLLKYMEKHFGRIFITVEEARLLSRFTEKMGMELDEFNDGKRLMEELEELRNYYKKAPLPEEREAFENRATLYQYMKDLENFIIYKTEFMNKQEEHFGR